MRAIVLNGHGGVDALEYDEHFPDPECGEDDVVVRVRSTSLNYHDIFTRNGMPGIKINSTTVPPISIQKVTKERLLPYTWIPQIGLP